MTFQQNLFDLDLVKPEAQTPPEAAHKDIKRKYISMDRHQMEFKMESLDSILPQNHEARTIWKFVEQLDLAEAEKKISTLQGCAGRPAFQPKLLIALWIYAITQGIISARKISEFCKDHRGFIWLSGGNSVGHHVLSNFMSSHSDLFEVLVIQSIALLANKGLVELKEVSQDGVKIKASASKKNFRRKKTLKEMKREVVERIKTLKDQQQKGEFVRAEKKEKERELVEAKKREKAINEALKEMEVFKNQKNENRLKHKKKKLSNIETRDLRTSISDPQCRKMRMADGSFQRAYNFQISTELNTELALGARVTQSGTDGGEMLRMYEHLGRTYGESIETYVVDEGYVSQSDVENLYEKGTQVHMPTEGKLKSLRKKVLEDSNYKESAALKELVNRMETDEAKEVYSKRMRVSETIHAYFRNHGLGQLPIRGMSKVLGMVNLFCLTYNMTVIKRLFDVL